MNIMIVLTVRNSRLLEVAAPRWLALLWARLLWAPLLWATLLGAHTSNASSLVPGFALHHAFDFPRFNADAGLVSSWQSKHLLCLNFRRKGNQHFTVETDTNKALPMGAGYLT